MGKRSNFERVERDFYPTPYEAVLPLVPHLTEEDDSFVAPCCGDGRLIQHLNLFDFDCGLATDIEPGLSWAKKADALTYDYPTGLTFIENPPWDRKILHPLIERLSDRGKTWLLFDADWLHTKQSIPFLPRLRKVVSVGRVKWIEDSKSTGKDNCCWYCFTAPSEEPTLFYGRT
jgi:hypothetical protein